MGSGEHPEDDRADDPPSRGRGGGTRVHHRDLHRSPHYLALGLPAESGAEGLSRVRARLSERRVFVSIRGDTIRVTPHLYNDVEDIEAFVSALASALWGKR